MKPKNLVLSVLFMAMSILFCAGILAANVAKGNNAFNISEPNYSPGQVIDGILNVSFKDVPNDYIRADVDNKKFSMLLSDFLNAQPQSVAYTCNPSSCQSFYQGTSPSPSKTYAMDEDSKVLFGLKINKDTCGDFPVGVDIQQLSFDMTGSALNTSYPRPSIDIGNDGKIDWQYLEPSDTISAKVPSNYVITNDSMKANGLIKGGKYCERIKMPLASKFKLKANVTTDGSPITLSVYDSVFSDETKVFCPANAPDFECEVNKNITEVDNYYVCVAVTCDTECGTINSYSGTGNLKNGVLYDDNSFSTVPLDPPGDFPIDVYFAGYKPLDKTISVNSQDLRDEAAIYLSNATNCNNASYCIIPVSISTTSKGNLILNNMNLQTNCIYTLFHDFYTISESKALINMNTTELQISVLNASSYKYGANTLTIRISDIFSVYDTFEIAKVPEITSLGPTVVAAGASTNFTVKASSPKNNAIIAYDWNFGDGGTDSTVAPNSVHTYNSIGIFNLTVTVTDKEGLVGSRIFTITSTSPGESINQTLATKKSLLAVFTSQYSSIPSWYKPLFANFDTTELGSILSKYEQDAKAASAADLISIKQKLDALAIPQNIIDAVKVADSVPIFSTDKISLIYLQKAGAGDYDENNAEQIKELISSWQSQLGIKLSGTVKRVRTDIGEEDVATIVTIKLNPTTEVDSLYLIVNLPSSVQFSDVKFDSTTGKNLNGAIGFELALIGEKTINLAMAGNQNINLLEVYGSPSFETLMAAIPIETKCGNEKCDAGETSQTCPSDCPPLAKGITFIVLIILGAGVGVFLIWKVYAAIYERSQEMKVFKNRNDLVSVTMFIVNAKVRGMPETEIREKLEKAGWNNEQIAFAFLKVEKRKKEIEKKIKEAKKLIEHKT
jgi:PKD repeat protein